MLQKVELAKTQPFSLISAAQLVANVLEKFQLLRPMVVVKVPNLIPHSSPLVACDTTLEQAILNLLNNAADASSEFVELKLSHTNQKVIVDICDKGLGFPQEVLTARGTEFVSTKGEQGMGIGLFLANATLERLGGDVIFLPREGGGVIARVILPIHSHATD
jgi:two-component system sensor histidine kinase RegB